MSAATTFYDVACSLGTSPADVFFTCIDQDRFRDTSGTKEQGQRSYEEGRMGRGTRCSRQGGAAIGQIDDHAMQIDVTNSRTSNEDIDDGTC
jgi:hypothetical protein